MAGLIIIYIVINRLLNLILIDFEKTNIKFKTIILFSLIL